MAHSQSKALLARATILPGESLSSFLFRLSLLNNYEAPSNLSQLLQQGVDKSAVNKDRIALPLRIETYQRLSELAHVEPSDLYIASTHHFASILTPPNIPLDHIEISDGNFMPLLALSLASKQLRPVGAGQFCPLCLRESAYHRLVWMPIAVSACLEHSCLLLDRCQQCNKKVDIREIVETQCRKCKSNLAEAKTLLLNNNIGLFSQRIIQSWLMEDASPDDTTPFLPSRVPRALYRVADGLQWAIRALTWFDWPYLHRIAGNSQNPIFQQSSRQNMITSYESHLLYTTAFKGLINWPEGFYELLQAYQTQFQSDKLLNGGPKADLGNLYTQWLQDYWQHPAFEFVHKAFEGYFTRHYSLSSSVARTNICQENLDVAEQLAYINASEAARLLGTTPKTVSALIKAEKLSYQVPTSPSERQYRLLLREEVLRLREQWNTEVARQEAAAYLGISEKLIIDLVQVGLLSARRGPAANSSHWRFSKSELARCLECVSKHVSDLATGGEKALLLDLPAASRLSFVVRVNAAMILAQVAEGKLQAYRRKHQALALGTLLFDRSDILNCVEIVKYNNHWLSRKEVTQRLKVKDGTLARWVKVGLIFPVQTFGNIQYFNGELVEKFIAEYITSEEAAKLLGINKLTIQKWARIGRLDMVCVSGPNIDGHHSYLFDRTKLIRWRDVQ